MSDTVTPIDPSIGPEQAREVFRAELADARTDAALQALRTRWVGRNNSWTAAFMAASCCGERVGWSARDGR